MPSGTIWSFAVEVGATYCRVTLEGNSRSMEVKGMAAQDRNRCVTSDSSRDAASRAVDSVERLLGTVLENAVGAMLREPNVRWVSMSTRYALVYRRKGV